MDISVVDLLAIAFAVLLLAAVGYFWITLFKKGTDASAPFLSRIVELPSAFQAFRSQKLSSREAAGWVFVGGLMLLIVLASAWK